MKITRGTLNKAIVVFNITSDVKYNMLVRSIRDYIQLPSSVKKITTSVKKIATSVKEILIEDCIKLGVLK